MATLKHSLRSYFKTPFVTVFTVFFSLEKNFPCFSRKLNRKKAISYFDIADLVSDYNYDGKVEIVQFYKDDSKRTDEEIHWTKENGDWTWDNAIREQDWI